MPYTMYPIPPCLRPCTGAREAEATRRTRRPWARRRSSMLFAACCRAIALHGLFSCKNYIDAFMCSFSFQLLFVMLPYYWMSLIVLLLAVFLPERHTSKP